MIKTNELPLKTGFVVTDSFLVDVPSGTGRLTGQEAINFLVRSFPQLSKLEELSRAIQNKASAVTMEISIPAESWTEGQDDSTGYPWSAQIANAAITSEMTAFVLLSRESQAAAIAAGVCAAAETTDGAVKLWAAEKPGGTLSGTMTLLLPNGEILLDEEYATDSEAEDAIHSIWG